MKQNPLLRKGDYWAIWIGSLLLFMGLMAHVIMRYQTVSNGLEEVLTNENIYLTDSLKTIEWYQAQDAKQSISNDLPSFAKLLKTVTGKPGKWVNNPLDAVYFSEKEAQRIRESALIDLSAAKKNTEDALRRARLAQSLAGEVSFINNDLNRTAEAAIESWRVTKEKEDKVRKSSKAKGRFLIPGLLALMIVLGLLFGAAASFLGYSFVQFLKGFTLVFLLATLAYWIAGQADLKAMGLGYALWAIMIGLMISNTLPIPDWLRSALQTELYIKTGLVLLGAEILLSKILAIGLPGLFVAWVVTPVVLITTYWFGQKILKIPSKSLNMTISADMSVCGVSAAVATAAACKATKEELTLAIGLSMVFTSIMMVVLPIFINWVGIPEVLGGAWIGGTIDATGAVVAAGAFLGEKALSVAATIKMIQNVLIGLIAFGVAIYFAKNENQENQKIGIGEIWNRFPKFILGFMGASILFSGIYQSYSPETAYVLIDQGAIGAFTKNLRGWLFCIAFVSIGLSTNFKDLRHQFSGGKPLILYLCGQSLNLALTLFMAYLMFYLVFPQITANI